MTDQTIERPTCACGCGQITPLGRYTSKRDGTVKGQPNKWALRHSRFSPVDRWTVDESGCWIWNFKRSKNGYGQSRSFGRTVLAHRAVWEQRYGIQLPPEVHLDHLCRVPLCVNPDHMEPTTPAENQRRSSNTKLTVEIAEEIRVAPGRMSDIATRYGISTTTVGGIKSGRIWGPVDTTAVDRIKALMAAARTPDDDAEGKS